MKIRKRSLCVIAGLLAALLLTGCSQRELQTNIGQEKIQVYASIYPIYDFAQKIGRDRIDLKLVTPPGAEPHDWEPTAKSIAKMKEADVFIYNGAGFEGWVDKLVQTIDSDSLIVVDASSGVELLEAKDHIHDHGHAQEHQVDPHIWLDPIRAKKQAENIKNAFIQADPANRAFYEKNYGAFSEEIESLHKQYKEVLSSVRRKEIIVSHAAFGYLAERYGLEQIPISGISPQEEPSPAKMAQITKLCRDRQVKYIFLETLASPKLAEVLANETGARTAVLNPMGGLTQQEIDAGKDYFSIMKENLEVLKKALGE